jgi:hypothetical protein
MIIAWPIDLLKPRDMNVSKLSATIKGNAAISGLTQRVASDAGRWSLKMDGIWIRDANQRRLWRAIEGLAQGQLGQFLVPICSRGAAPSPMGVVELPHSDDSLFSDGVGYEQSNYTARLGASVTLGASQCVIVHDLEDPPQPGDGFEVGIGRYHHITSIISSETGQVTVSVWPTFRDPAYLDDSLNFGSPRLLCRLADDDQMAIDVFSLNKFATPSVSFIEDTGPLL